MPRDGIIPCIMPMSPFPRLRPLGDSAWVVEFGSTIDEATHARVMGFAEALAQQASGPAIVESVPAYTSVTVHFRADDDTDLAGEAATGLLELARAAAPLVKPGRCWRLPVCFDDAEFAPDLEPLARSRGLEPQRVVELMTSTAFRVYMLGFQPGFPYLGGLPAALEMPRRATPRTAVPERSLAVAGRMCAVYPWRSPGGWHLLGRTPLRLFDASRADDPAWLQPGDEVRWVAVDRARFDDLERRAAAGVIVRDAFCAAELGSVMHADARSSADAASTSGALPRGGGDAIAARSLGADLARSGGATTGAGRGPASGGREATTATDRAGSVEFIDAGVGVSIQDGGRVGHRRIGVPLAGAADPVLLACANALLAQAADEAALEIALLGPTLRAQGAPLQLALAGDFAPRMTSTEGVVTPLASWRSITLQPGEVLTVGPCRSGIGYLALAGGCDVPPVLGSRSTYARAALGGIDGRAPRAGDRLRAGAAPGADRRAPRPFVRASGPLRMLPGPQDDHFDADEFARFTATEWRVSREADRMGARLEGPALRHRPDKGADIVSEAVVPGAVQVPAAGTPIVLGVDAQTIGGYAKIATVIRADLPRLAHARPGDLLRFAVVTRAEALAARREAAAAFADWVRRIEPLHGRGAAAIETALQASNLISGMIDAGASAADNLPWE